MFMFAWCFAAALLDLLARVQTWRRADDADITAQPVTGNCISRPHLFCVGLLFAAAYMPTATPVVRLPPVPLPIPDA